VSYGAFRHGPGVEKEEGPLIKASYAGDANESIAVKKRRELCDIGCVLRSLGRFRCENRIAKSRKPVARRSHWLGRSQRAAAEDLT